jgi:phosphatidylinositol alpha 1,6-mannosyltransferase
MEASDLRIALFSGNYNYVRDGANQALNRLVGYLLRQGAAVRVYSPTSKTPAFSPTGDLVSVASLPFPFGRGEYRFTLGMPSATRRDLEAFAPNMIHVSAPDVLGHRAVNWARHAGLPVAASMHTRFETYLRYYGLGFAEPAMVAMLRRFYARCNIVLAPTDAVASEMRAEAMGNAFAIWARGIDTHIFSPDRRDQAFRRSLGVDDATPIIGYLGRLVLEKGLGIYAAAIANLQERGVDHRVVMIGDGPARAMIETELPNAILLGHQSGEKLGRALASMDVLLNPSVTEAFGNVNLEAMACRLPVVAANAPGNSHLVQDGVTGRLVDPTSANAFADALEAYCRDPALRTLHGAAGLSVSKGYDWDQINQSVLDTYLKLVNSPQSRES